MSAVLQHSPSYFDAMFRADGDPWQFKSRWYESRKRALTLASLPSVRYGAGYEPGCANGELSAALASRCDSLLVSDGSATAVSAARTRLAGLRNVRVREMWVPSQWPSESFDLIVISELAYYLGSDDLDDLAAKTRASLRDGGTVLACHWRHRINGCLFDGDEVHERLNKRLAMTNLSHLIEPDLRLDVWSCDVRSVAQREGFA